MSQHECTALVTLFAGIRTDSAFVTTAEVRKMVKMKKTVSFDTRTYNKLVKLQRLARFNDFSETVDYICYRALTSPLDVVRDRLKDSCASMEYFRRLKEEIEARIEEGEQDQAQPPLKLEVRPL